MVRLLLIVALLASGLGMPFTPGRPGTLVLTIPMDLHGLSVGTPTRLRVRLALARWIPNAPRTGWSNRLLQAMGNRLPMTMALPTGALGLILRAASGLR